MKIVPILAITNALALGAALLLFLEVDDLKSEVGNSRGTSRVESDHAADPTSGYTRAQLDRAIERVLARRGSEGVARVKTESIGDQPADSGKGIDRGYANPENFDKELERNRPEMDYFRQRVRLAQDLNQDEDQVNREIDRIDRLIDSARIGSMTPVQKKKVAEALVESRGKTRLIWTGLRQREDLQSVPQEDRREAFRSAYQKEAGALKVETRKSLESVIPAADAAAILESGRGGDTGFGGRRSAGRNRSAAR